MRYEIIENFLSLAAIPHKSHHEEAISEYLYSWALKKGFSAERDSAGNVIIEKAATPGFENAPRVILQGHMDMVVVWEDGKRFDPLKDAIIVADDGERLHALGTSLGADDCIGVAMAMTVLEDESAVHGPLRCIFTVNEEDGMTGAEALDARHLDADYLINLDWEEFGSLCCSSAGSDQYRISRVPHWVDSSDQAAFSVRITGMTGGHSGTAIHHGRANAIKTLAGMLAVPVRNGIHVQLASFEGGNAHNAIPGSASAVVTVPKEDWPFFLAIAQTEGMCRRTACLDTDPDTQITVTPLENAVERSVCAEDSADYLLLLDEVFHGVRSMSGSFPGLVESSANVGVASLTENTMQFLVHPRSSSIERMEEMRTEYREKAEKRGFSVEVLMSSPAWPVRENSRLLSVCTEEFRQLTGRDMVVAPVHAGLECGSFAEKNPSLDIISIGPDILDIHSPRETLILQTVYDCDELVRRILKKVTEL